MNGFQNHNTIRKTGKACLERLCCRSFYPWKFSEHNYAKLWATWGFAKEAWTDDHDFSSNWITLWFYEKKVWFPCDTVLIYIPIRHLLPELSRVLANYKTSAHWVSTSMSTFLWWYIKIERRGWWSSSTVFHNGPQMPFKFSQQSTCKITRGSGRL